jgi:hypothetical protein
VIAGRDGSGGLDEALFGGLAGAGGRGGNLGGMLAPVVTPFVGEGIQSPRNPAANFSWNQRREQRAAASTSELGRPAACLKMNHSLRWLKSRPLYVTIPKRKALRTHRATQ